MKDLSFSEVFNQCTVKAQLMRWLKRDLWKAGITIICMLLLLTLMVWIQVSVAHAYEGASGSATPVTGTVQATPTIDATVTALNKEKLAQEVQQLKNQNEQYKSQNEQDPNVWFQNYGFVWLRTNASIVLSTLVVVIGGLIGLGRWLGDRSAARNENLNAQAEERFKTAVTALGDRDEGVQVGGAILLRTFLRPVYRQFYIQTFDLAVAYLCLQRTPLLPEDPDGIPRSPDDSDTPLPLTPIRQALIVAFKEAFPRARNLMMVRYEDEGGWHRHTLDASGIQLDKAYLMVADLKGIWMPQAFLRGAELGGANLSEAVLSKANLSLAHLNEANLSGAYLGEAEISEADLSEANLMVADLSEANLSGANLSGADLSGSNLEDARSLEGTKLHGVKGLTKEQLETCKAKGAIIDKTPIPSSSQSPTSPSPPSQSNEAQAPLTSPAQVNTPPHSTDGSSVTSSQQNLES